MVQVVEDINNFKNTYIKKLTDTRIQFLNLPELKEAPCSI